MEDRWMLRMELWSEKEQGQVEWFWLGGVGKWTTRRFSPKIYARSAQEVLDHLAFIYGRLDPPMAWPAGELSLVPFFPCPQKLSTWCQTGKYRYPTEREAAQALLIIWSAGMRPKRQERRWYPCTECQGYHLTKTERAREVEVPGDYSKG